MRKKKNLNAVTRKQNLMDWQKRRKTLRILYKYGRLIKREGKPVPSYCLNPFIYSTLSSDVLSAYQLLFIVLHMRDTPPLWRLCFSEEENS